MQRVKRSSVTIDNQVHGKIGQGFMLLVGVEDSDGPEEIKYLVHKISKLRVFEDENDKLNLDLATVGGEILSISQFTLYADTKKGNRPSFINAGKPDHAKKIYQQFNDSLRNEGIKVETGIFGADMAVELINDGPVTIIFDTDNR